MVEYAEHQKRAISFQNIQPYSLCAMATGVGKSLTTMGSELLNLHQNKLNKCIFVCTKGSIGEVLNDYNKFFSFTPKSLYNSDTINNFFNSDSTVAVTRYEWLKHFDEKLLMQVSSNNKIGMWWDEAQKLKNTSTRAYKQASIFRKYCDAFHLVTATPIMTKLEDLWSLFSLIDKNVLGTKDQFEENYYNRVLVPHPKMAYRKRECPACGALLRYFNGWDICTNSLCKAVKTPTGFIPYRVKVKSLWEVIDYKNIEMLSRKVFPYMFCFFPKQDINYVIKEFELEASAHKKYHSIAVNTINEEDDVAFSTRLIELQYAVDRSEAKRRELFKLANEIKHKGFVLYLSLYNTIGMNDTKSTLEQVQEVLDCVEGLSYRTYTGNDDDDERDKNKKWFQEDPKNKCLIITKAGGASLNLQVTNEFVFYSLPDGFGAMSQALGRVVRYFSSFNSFNIHILQAKRTIDVYKYITFLMYSEVIQKIMNNNLIGLKDPISYNANIKKMIRKAYCWHTNTFS